ncbi:MAG TPA: hypothetical protein VIK52_11015 [Opitutaceae bacterium]
MKANLVSTLLLAVALGATAMSAAPNTTTAYAFPVSHVRHQHMQIGIGSTEMTVRQVLGMPNRRLSPQVCVYYNFHAQQELANDFGCNAMIVTFAKGKVVDLKFANLTAVKIIARNLKTKPDSSSWQVAANK